MVAGLKENVQLTFTRHNLPEQTYDVSDCGTIDLSICLVNWNTCALLKECLKSIFDYSDGLSIEIFVIDNASSDDSVEMVKSDFPDVHLVENVQNQGFARANNQGIAEATGRHIFLLNPDTLILPGTLRKMVEFLDSDPSTGAVAAKLLNTDGSLQYSLRKFPNILTPFTENTNLSILPGIKKYSKKSRLMDWDHNQIREVEQPAGAAFMIKRHVLETLGPLNSCYHMFFEDVDICYRIRKNGWRIFYLPDAPIIHHGGQSVKKRSDMGVQFYRSLIKYFRLHNGKSGVYFVRLSMIALSLYCLSYATIRLPVEWSDSLVIGKSALNVIRAALYRQDSTKNWTES